MSGPAGGVIGASAVAKLNGIDETIGFDMGGTSTDVSRYGGEFEKVVEVETSGIHFQTPSLKINTVAAGGGSILCLMAKKCASALNQRELTRGQSVTIKMDSLQ